MKRFEMLSFVLLALLGLGCTAELQSGVYGCAEGECPAGYTCGPDALCYSPEADVPLDLYEACDVDSDCASGSCVRAFDSTATLGQCSSLPDCSSSAACPMAATRAGVCAPGIGCLGACSGAADCDSLQDCLMVPMTVGETACLELASPDYAGKTACVMPMDCPRGALCVKASMSAIGGVCQWACALGLSCAQGANCVRHDDMIADGAPNTPRFACMAPCDSAAAGSCGMPSPVVCQAYPPPGPEHCAPSEWSALFP